MKLEITKQRMDLFVRGCIVDDDKEDASMFPSLKDAITQGPEKKATQSNG